MRSIDLNSDLGEGAGADELIMPSITSANVACGAHAGDAATMRRTVELALRHGVAIGAHPGYRDRKNFGRLAIDLTRQELLDEIRSQIEELRAIAHGAGARVSHVKAHGALYNRAERDADTARAVTDAVRETDEDLVVFAPPGSAMEAAARESGLRVAREGFCDRSYEPEGTLRPRRLTGALLTDPRQCAAQALALARDGTVVASDGRVLRLEVDSLCVHGDTPGADEIARAVRAALEAAGIAVRSLLPR